MMQVYQLRDRKAVDAADYQTLLRKANTVSTLTWTSRGATG